MSITRNTDARIRKTRKAIRQAAAEILENEGWDSLSVASICSAADCARSTFYLHYNRSWEPVADLLLDDFRKDFEGIAGKAVVLDTDSLLVDGYPLSYPLFSFAQSRQKLFVRIFGENADPGLEKRIHTETARLSLAHHAPLRALSDASKEPELLAEFTAGALLGVLGWWVRSGFPESAKSMSYRFSQMAAPGLLQAMGLQSILDSD